MENLKSFLGITLVVVVGWHIKVGIEDNRNIVGLFKVKPAEGYNWQEVDSNQGGIGILFKVDEKSGFPQIQSISTGTPAERQGLLANDFIIKIDDNTVENWTQVQVSNAIVGQIGSIANLRVWRNGEEFDLGIVRARIEGIDDKLRIEGANNPTEHYFWDKNEVLWCAGSIHPKYKVWAGDEPGSWFPLAGYEFKTSPKDNLETIWKAGLKHPNMNAYSAKEEQKWIPLIGYEFIKEDGLAVDTQWSPGKRYDDLKVYSGQQQDTYYAYDGYQFVDPKNSLDVVWTPGLLHPNNPDLVAGIAEGSWQPKVQEYISTEPTAADHIGNAIVGGLAGKVIEWIFGENVVSDQIYKESTKEGFKGVVQSIK